jgi:hypothetical protein
MEIKSIQLDRSKLSSEHIASRQNFKQIVKCCEAATISPLKSPLFFGAMGLSSLTLIVLMCTNDQTKIKETNSQNDVVDIR